MQIIVFLDKWQQLIGAALGAGVPISVGLISLIYRRHEEKKRNLALVEKSLVLSINSVLSAERTIKEFVDVSLPQTILNIDEKTESKNYSLDVSYFPTVYIHVLGEEIIKLNTGSGYIDERLLQLQMLSRELVTSIHDMRSQFYDAVAIYRTLGLNKSNPEAVHNEEYKNALIAFNSYAKEVLLEKNIKVFLGVLGKAHVALLEYMRIGHTRWHFRFSPSLKYFRDYKALRKHKEEAHTRVNQYLFVKVQEYNQKIEVSKNNLNSQNETSSKK